jgi:hypothetical protein
METYVLDRASYSIPEVVEGIKQGRVPLCPLCNSQILVASTPEEARAQGIPPGMRCANDARHFQVIFNLRRN